MIPLWMGFFSSLDLYKKVKRGGVTLIPTPEPKFPSPIAPYFLSTIVPQQCKHNRETRLISVLSTSTPQSTMFTH